MTGGFVRRKWSRARSCSRMNPPNRVACLYCGIDLDMAERPPDAVRLSRQRPEPWEDGFTVVYLGRRDSGPDTAEAAEILGLEPDVLVQIERLNAPAPVAYLRSLAEAQIVAGRLTGIGFPAAVAGDDLLLPRTPPSRLRAIELGEAGAVFLDFNTGSRFEFGSTDRSVLVAGVICKTRSETTAKRSKRAMKVTDAAESINDEPVLDIYPPADVFGFRVRPTGFDFSCLGDRMQRTGGENLQMLTDLLAQRFPGSTVITSYRQLRFVLDEVWPLSEGDRSSTVSRASFGGVRIQRVSLVDNTTQFTRFSRLQRHLL